MWREFLLSFTDGCQFSPPASPVLLAEVERELDVQLPKSLSSLLTETDGATATLTFAGLEDEEPFPLSLFWSTQEMLRENAFYRSLNTEQSASLGKLLFFARAPNGNPIAFLVKDGIASETPLFTMSHEDYKDGEWKHKSLRDYLAWFLAVAAEHRG